MRDESRSKILLLHLHIEGRQVGWREFCILSLMDFAGVLLGLNQSIGSIIAKCMYEATCAEFNIV